MIFQLVTVVVAALGAWTVWAQCHCPPIAGTTSLYGPQASITCPPSSILVGTAASLQSAINAAPAASTFCLAAGVHPITAAVTPKSGTTLIGQFGAILDGSSWVLTGPDYTAAIMAHSQDIDDVTIRNLVIRNMPQRAIHAFYQFSDRWTIEWSEITGNRSGISLSNAAILRHNFIHHNNGDSVGGSIPNGGYIGSKITGALLETNEISFNGAIQKIVDGTSNVTFRDNYLHDNLGTAIWFDGDNVSTLIEGNRLEDNGLEGIHYEISGAGVIRNNTIRRSGDNGLFVSTSRDLDISGNTFDANFRAVNLFVACENVHPPGVPFAGAIGWDLRNNAVHDNVVIVGSQPGAWGNDLATSGACTAADLTTYTNAKGNTFTHNGYTVPTTGGTWWFLNGLKTFAQWQAAGFDTTGTVTVGS